MAAKSLGQETLILEQGASRCEIRTQIGGSIGQATDALRYAVVCIRREQEVLCFEPVPHMSNAVNRRGPGNAMPELAAGATFRASIVFRAEESLI